MRENLPEQKINERVNVLREKLKDELARIFDDKEGKEKKFNELVARIEKWHANGLTFDKEMIIKGIEEGLRIKNKDEFIAYLLQIFEPIIPLRFTQSEVWEKVSREETINHDDNIRLSEVLYANIDEGAASIHLAPASALIRKEGIGNFRGEIESGLKKLAQIIKGKEEVKEITAYSWIIAKNPKLVTNLGFSISNEPLKEEWDGYSGEKRPVGAAFISREDFLERYLK